MITLSLDHAHKYLLQVLDELKNLESGAMLAETDELDTKKLTEGYIVEAALKAHKDAPAHLVNGKIGTEKPRKEEDVVENETYDYSVSFDSESKVASIQMLQKSARLASLKASDSNIVVTEAIPEDQPAARMQNNKYVRGTYDDPRVIVNKLWEDDYLPTYTYYSTVSAEATFSLEYVPYPEIKDGGISISPKLEYAVLTLLVAMVLDALSYPDKANLYRAKYQEYLQVNR
jgi:hypothetical protein